MSDAVRYFIPLESPDTVIGTSFISLMEPSTGCDIVSSLNTSGFCGLPRGFRDSSFFTCRRLTLNDNISLLAAICLLAVSVIFSIRAEYAELSITILSISTPKMKSALPEASLVIIKSEKCELDFVMDQVYLELLEWYLVHLEYWNWNRGRIRLCRPSPNYLMVRRRRIYYQ